MLVIFPEGNIFRDQQVHPLKEGLARIALQVQANAPEKRVKIVPVSIHYSDVYPHWGTDVYVDLSSPIEVGDYDTNSPKHSAKELTSDLESTLKSIYEHRLGHN
jgi:1-acyl-sn-glycerol-3-phosphate acyltransferase